MSHSEAQPILRERSVRSANEIWKTRWSRWVLASTVVGAVGHAIVFVVIPAWEIRATAKEPVVEMIQIDPVLAFGAEFDGGDEMRAAELELERVVLESLDEGASQISDEQLTELLEMFGQREPAVVTPIARQDRLAESLPLPPLELGTVEPLSPRLAQTLAMLDLPVIRNPTVLQRFLRSRYNPIYHAPDGNGFVSVAMWINARGAVEWTAISESSGYPNVDQIALDVFNDIALFTPARSEGERVPVSVVISVPFTAPW